VRHVALNRVAFSQRFKAGIHLFEDPGAFSLELVPTVADDVAVTAGQLP
jgi:hypothetical protein